MINPFMHRSDLPLIFQNGILNDYDTFFIDYSRLFQNCTEKGHYSYGVDNLITLFETFAYCEK